MQCDFSALYRIHSNTFLFTCTYQYFTYLFIYSHKYIQQTQFFLLATTWYEVARSQLLISFSSTSLCSQYVYIRTHSTFLSLYLFSISVSASLALFVQIRFASTIWPPYNGSFVILVDSFAFIELETRASNRRESISLISLSLLLSLSHGIINIISFSFKAIFCNCLSSFLLLLFLFLLLLALTAIISPSLQLCACRNRVIFFRFRFEGFVCFQCFPWDLLLWFNLAEKKYDWLKKKISTFRCNLDIIDRCRWHWSKENFIG